VKNSRCVVYVNALARYVHARGMRFQATGNVRAAEQKYDRHFHKAIGIVERTKDGFRLTSEDGALCFNLPADAAGKLFKELPS
jgi:hypothetical protein